ncbi:MAG: MG2 domain-containing protein, partial [bacterium]
MKKFFGKLRQSITNWLTGDSESPGEESGLKAWLMSNREKTLLDLKKEGNLSDQQYRTLRDPLPFKSGIVLIVVIGLILFLTGAGVSLYTLTQSIDKSGVPSISDSEPQALKIMSFSPKGNVDDVDEINATFNKSMVESDSQNVIFEDFPVSVSPDLNVNFMWTTDNKLKIMPQKPIPPGTRASFTFKKSIRDLTGKTLNNKRSFSFHYKPLNFDEVRHKDYIEDHLEFDLEFNSKVVGRKVGEYLSVTDEDDYQLEYKIEDPDDEDDDVRVSLPNKSFNDLAGEKLYFRIKPGLTTARGNAPTTEQMTESYHLGKLTIDRVRGREHEAEPYIEVDFNRSIDEISIRDLKKYIKLDVDESPRILNAGYDEIKIKSDKLTFGERFRVTIKKGLKVGPYVLTEKYEKEERIPNPDPFLRVKSKGVFQSKKGKRVLPVQYVNTDTLHVKVHQLYPNNLVFYANSEKYDEDRKELYHSIADTAFSLPEAKNVLRTAHLDLDPLIGDEQQGPKIIEFTYPGNYRYEERLLVLSDLGISYKRIDQTLVTLVSSLKNGEPIRNAEVEVYSRANQKLASGRTDENGVARFDKVSFKKGTPNIVVARKGDDVNYLHIEKGRFSTVTFDISGDPYTESNELDAYVHGEREIYRPGEKVNLKVLARGRDLKRINDLPLKITITGPDGNKVYQRTHQLDQYGTVEFTYPSYREAVTGKYSVAVSIPSTNQLIGQGKFQLETFVPDRIETNVTALSDKAKPGDSVSFRVEGRYLFGKPAAKNKVKGAYSLVPTSFTPDDYPQYRFGDNRVKLQNIFERAGARKLSKNGFDTYTVSVPDNLKPPSALEMVFTGTVFEMGSRGVSGRASTTIHPYPYYLGIRSLVE